MNILRRFLGSWRPMTSFYTAYGLPAGGQGKSHNGKLLLIGAVEIVSGKNNKLTLGRMRLASIADFARTFPHAFIGANIAPGRTVKTYGLATSLGIPMTIKAETCKKIAQVGSTG